MSIAPGLGENNHHTTEKTQRVLGGHPHPTAVTVIDCAEILISHRVL